MGDDTKHASLNILTQEGLINSDKIKARKNTTIFFPNLDGLRFFCFISVFFFHSFATKYSDISESGVYYFVKGFLFANGSLGVNFFFVLSGFLITYLLIVEKTNYHSIKVGDFYVRRVLRIWPLFYACIIFGFFFSLS